MTFKEILLLLLRWSRANENLFATTGCPGKICSQLLIHHLGHPQVSELLSSVLNFIFVMICTPPVSHHSLDVPTAGDDRICHGGIWPQLAPDAPTLCDWQRQETLLLDDWNVALRLCFYSNKCSIKYFSEYLPSVYKFCWKLAACLNFFSLLTAPLGAGKQRAGWLPVKNKFFFFLRVTCISSRMSCQESCTELYKEIIANSPPNMIITQKGFLPLTFSVLSPTWNNIRNISF